MKIIDISWPLDATTTVAPGEQPVLFEPTKTFAQDEVREHIIHLNAHAGTHIDAPYFLFRDGSTVDRIDLNSLAGPANVIDLTEVEESVKAEDLQHHDIRPNDVILLKTKNSQLSPTAPYDPSFIYLDISAAEYLVEQKVKTVGFDYIILEPEKEFYRAHRVLLHHNITVIAGIRLYGVAAGVYFFFSLPLFVVGIEAAPARTILLDVSEEIAMEQANK